MNTLVIVLISAICLASAYVLYGRFLAKKWGIDRKPKHRQSFTRTDRTTSHRRPGPFSAISFLHSPEPACDRSHPGGRFGWVPVLLWILIGGVFFGAVTDFGALYVSVKMMVSPWDF